MKIATATKRLYPREFSVKDGLVQFRSPASLPDAHIPIVLKISSLLSPLVANLQIWAELLHDGDDDPIGHDRLHAHLVLAARPIFIRNPPSVLLDTVCDSLDSLNKWISSVKKAMLAANDFAFLPGFSRATTQAVFAPLFDAVAELHGNFMAERLARTVLWQKHCRSIMDDVPYPLRKRFTLPFQ